MSYQGSGGGRPHHGMWKEHGFKRIMKNNKAVALCNICGKTLQNTSQIRLKTHRNVCKNGQIVSTCSTSNTKNNSILKQGQKQQLIDNMSVAAPALQEPEPETEAEVEDILLIVDENEHDDTNQDNTILSLSNKEEIEICHIERTNNSNSNENIILDMFDADADIDGSEIHCENESFETESVLTDGTSDISLISLVSKTAEKTKPEEPARKKMKKDKSASFFDKMSIEEKSEGDKFLAKFFFGCNIPFSIVESKWFRKFINYLRPAYKIPSRKTLSSTLLEACYNDEIRDKSLKLCDECCLLLDGWKNSSNNTKNVAAMLQNAQGDAIFLDSWDLDGERETGEYLSNIVQKCIALAKEIYKTDLYAVVTDNASNMKKMGRICGLWHVPCNSHTANLLAKDLVPKNISNEVTTILKVFCGPEMERLVLKYGGSRIQLPIDTRWCSYRDSFQCFINNLPAFKKIAASDETADLSNKNLDNLENISRKVFDSNFCKNIQDCINLFNPICTLINICQSKAASIADAAESWLNLKIPDQYGDTSKEFMEVEKRKNYALNIYSLCANYLHPKYRGRNLLHSHMEEVELFLLSHLDKNGLEDVISYKNTTGIFLTLSEKDIEQPEVFWEFAKRKHPSLANLAMRLLKIPASSAQLERLFSQWSFVHNNLRNRLTNDHSKKLLHVYYSLKLQDSNKCDDY